MPRVSVLMPCRDCAATLPVALDSLLSQTMADFEVVAVDDGSQDSTPIVLREYAARDPRIRPLFQEPGGIVTSLNRAASASRSPYLARMDGDDLSLPDRLALQAKLLDEKPNLGLASCLVRYGGDREANLGYALYVDWTNSLTTPKDISLNRFVESPLPHPSVLFRRELLDRHGFYREGDFPEDYELWLRLLDRDVAMAKVPKELLVWNDPPDRLSRTDPRYSLDSFYAVKAAWLARWLERNNPRHPWITLIGAGRTARKRADALAGHGVEIEAFVDIDPRKVGKTVHGRPVLHRNELGPPGERFLVSYVASRGAREEIAAFLQARGHLPGRDFLLAA